MGLPHVEPMVLVRGAEAFDHPDFLFEAKLDGFRAVAYIENGRCELVSRKKHAYRAFDRLAREIARSVPVREAVLDGEIVCPGIDGRPRFDDLLYRRGDPHFYAFDLMWLNGEDLRKDVLTARKARLRELVPLQPSLLLYVDHVPECGIELYQLVCERDMEGIVAKWAHGEYSAGSETSWVKIKNPAYSQAVGRHDQFAGFRRFGVRPGRAARSGGDEDEERPRWEPQPGAIGSRFRTGR